MNIVLTCNRKTSTRDLTKKIVHKLVIDGPIELCRTTSGDNMLVVEIESSLEITGQWKRREDVRHTKTGVRDL